jgi:hypothetical protein
VAIIAVVLASMGGAYWLVRRGRTAS